MIPPAELYSYLIQKGVPSVHALGVINNIPHESGFRPEVNEVSPIVPGSRGGFGLFQHTGPRRKALESFAGDQVSDWRKQVDFALSEPETQNYLSQDFSDPAEASRWFTTNWLRPQDKERKAEQRLSTLGDFLPLAGIDPRMAGDMTGAPAVSPHTLPDKMMMNSNPSMSLLHEQALNQVMGLLADKPERPMHWADVAGALGSGLLNVQPGQNAWGSALGSLNQSLQARRQAQMEQPRTDAYRAQTLLATMNQFGAKGLSPDERYRAIRNEVWMSPDGTQTAVFRYDPSFNNGEGGYPEGPPPAGWSNIDKGMPPGMHGGGGGGDTDRRWTPAWTVGPDGNLLSGRKDMNSGDISIPGEGEYIPRTDPRAASWEVGTNPPATRLHLKNTERLQNVYRSLTALDSLKQVAFGAEGSLDVGAFPPEYSGFFGRLGQGIENAFNEWRQAEDKPDRTTLYRRIVKSYGTEFARALGETGPLSEGDINRAVDMLPKTGPLPDTRQVAQALIAVLEDRFVNTAKDLQRARESTGGLAVPEAYRDRLLEDDSAGTLPPTMDATPPSGGTSGGGGGFDMEEYNRAIDAATSVEEIQAIQQRFGVQ